MSLHSLVVRIDTGQSQYSPDKGYKHLATDIKDFLIDDLQECEMGWEIKSVHLLPTTEQTQQTEL